ncbi:hypothetical protein [Sphingomonas sp.]|uniref:PAS domain-containing protein n=1 Tax=Sphingomonas sp. TaxID=28214 RepID=UPI001ECB0435|nr:hypothetical protein [Sphingomonas sp.]MBX3594131.1 hypothetical protein [Sphingomonas sp.]
MDTARGLHDRYETDREDDVGVSDSADDRPRIAIGTDERRMHVRAYNHWVSLLRGRAYPAIEDLDPTNIADFGPHSVLLDFTAGIEDPAIRFLGASLREECGVTADIGHVAEVPSRSLLSRLTDHYLQIIANRAPIGFEAEFVGQRGHQTLYRGILMPFSSNGDAIDFIYGVINWKELVDAETQARLEREVEEARRACPPPAQSNPIWADGPSAGFSTPDATEVDATEDDPEENPAMQGDESPALADQLQLARESAAASRAADTRSRASLYRALSRAYDFALAADADADGYRELLDDAGVKVQARAPMTAPAKLVFGADYDKKRLTEFATVLSHARRTGVARGGLDGFLDTMPGGIKGIVKAERAHRRPVAPPDTFDRIRAELMARAPLAHVPLAAGGSDLVILLARAGQDGMLDVVGRIDDDVSLARHAVRKVAA